MAAEQPPDGPGRRPRRGWWIAAGLLALLPVVALVVLTALGKVSWWWLVGGADWAALVVLWATGRRQQALQLAGATIVVGLVVLWVQAPALYGKGDAAKGAAATTRGAILTVAAALIAATAADAGLYMTARTLAETQRANREADQRDRYAKAIEQLGNDKLDVRLGGIYGLERIAETSERDQRTVVEVLSAFVRERTDPARTEKPTVADVLNTFLTLVDHRPERNPTPSDAGTKIKPPADVQAAFTVLGRLPQRHNVSRGDLSNARLSGANLTDARLGQTGLDSALRFEASPAGAQLGSVDLSGARLVETHLSGADLFGANLSDAWLGGADLITTKNLTQQQLDSASGDKDTKLPAGLQRPAHWSATD